MEVELFLPRVSVLLLYCTPYNLLNGRTCLPTTYRIYTCAFSDLEAGVLQLLMSQALNSLGCSMNRRIRMFDVYGMIEIEIGQDWHFLQRLAQKLVLAQFWADIFKV